MRLAIADWETPLGRLVVGATESGVVRVAFADDGSPEDVREELALSLGVRPTRDASLTGPVRSAISDFLSGRVGALSLPVDWSLVPEGFTRRVLRAAARIPFGSVATYGEVAARAGAPRGGRAAGNALNRNPVPIVVPCHRVVPSSGGIGGYGGQEWRKARLLDLEAGAS